MKIEYIKNISRKIRQINFYQKDSEKKLDTQKESFLNFKISEELENLNRRKFISLIPAVRRHIFQKI